MKKDTEVPFPQTIGELFRTVRRVLKIRQAGMAKTLDLTQAVPMGQRGNISGYGSGGGVLE